MLLFIIINLLNSLYFIQSFFVLSLSLCSISKIVHIFYDHFLVVRYEYKKEPVFGFILEGIKTTLVQGSQINHLKHASSRNTTTHIHTGKCQSDLVLFSNMLVLFSGQVELVSPSFMHIEAHCPLKMIWNGRSVCI